ncbi:snRNA-activating protein complex subunit 1-like [Anoplopoma fimbria]|uniref:snRNA-activating protein complex subunit 1-like n=1 Tax=Anoplopoma fimbria TaxID=229290 RepID=UPI0023ED05BE|nr:snRNA-activating protein complex subunit 1-like [Anoplopoma fimbria]
MPRVQPIYSDIFYDPLTEDVEELLARFQQTESIRFQDFSAIWREMGFSDVFRGTLSMGEMKRFCRVALATAVKFFMPPYSYQIRVGGLYLMFSLYHTQLASPPVKIRFALRDWALVEKFLKDSADSGHQDVVYVFQKLVAIKAVHYAAMQHFLAFQKQRKPKMETVCAEFLGRTTAVQELSSADVLEEVANIQSQYEKLKEATTEVSCKVTMTYPEFSNHVKDCMSKFITWQHKTFSKHDKDKNSDDEEEEEEEKQTEAEYCSSRAQLLSSIKQKSYGNFQEESKSRRHRQAETVESSSSGAEQVQERPPSPGHRKRPPSLRARTRKSLGVTREECKLQAWLLSVPEETQQRSPVRRYNQTAPIKP